MSHGIDATIGRQLVMDDYLFVGHDLVRTWYQPRQHENNPLLVPVTGTDLNGGRCPVAAPFDDGIALDRRTGDWKLWYMSGWFDRTHLRASRDGLDWYAGEPRDLAGLAYHRDGGRLQRDGASVCVDYSGGQTTYKLLRYVRQRPVGFSPDTLPRHDSPVVSEGAALYTSDDGTEWRHLTEVGPCGDNSNFFFDPFRNQWVFSIRTHLGPFGRGRGWHAGTDLRAAADWTADEVVPWIGSHGLGDGDTVEDLRAPEIYKVTCMPYESLMLGVFAVYRGPSNDWAERHGTPKIIDLYLGSSRDAFHFSLAPAPLLTSSRIPGTWNYGYLHMVNGGMLPVGQEVRIYYTGFSGRSPQLNSHMYAGGSMGVATLRRDGFAALGAGNGGHGRARTKPLRVRGDHLFVNATTGSGDLTVSVLTADQAHGHGVRFGPGLDSTACGTPLDVGACDLERNVTLELELTGNARLYSFWFSDDSGESRGYCASGPIE